ncbi:MAG: hypothetical protein BA869_07280 [Desulfuromonadales bacterium C00003107]|nr:MAG: hypothetical protein BA869_07280 [Desulfuromonadales bacterium C00003107]
MQAHNLQIARRNLHLCRFCGICRDAVSCPTEPGSVDCTGCGACHLACPYEAIEILPREQAHERMRLIKVIIDGEIFFVPERITVSDALAFAGYQVSDPCGVGGCFACALVIGGETKPACVTAVAEGMKIDTMTKPEPLRVVSGFAPHVVGGVGTPHTLKNYTRPVEVACFLHGCNYRCPQCQNHVMAFTGGVPMTPKSVAGILIGIAEAYHVGRVAFSGGEATLNREFLIKVIKLLRTRDSDLRIHVDTNGSLLTTDYIDELVDAGMTDIGIDLKALSPDTFTKITAVSEDRERFLKISWDAVKYILDNHDIFVGIGIPYNRALMPMEEIRAMGEKIAQISKDVQVCLLDYRAAFRRRDLVLPTVAEMAEAKEALNSVGLRNVIAQTVEGHIGP